MPPICKTDMVDIPLPARYPSFRMTPPAQLGFPDTYLQPLRTALGNAWPRPRVRRIMEELDNVQKRMTALQLRMNGINRKPKKDRQAIWMQWQEEMKMLELELQRLMTQFQQFPVSKEQFKRPDAELSECCDAYVHDIIEDEGQPTEKRGWKCVDCGNFCKTYKRLDREEWAKEYREAMADAKAENEQQMKDHQHLEEIKKGIAEKNAPASGLQGGWLIT